MKSKPSIISILVIAIAGILFSGYLSYYSLFSTGCSQLFVTCGGSNPVEIIGLPTCVYGFFMYLLVIILSIIALVRDEKRSLQKAIFIISVVGVLFSGGLSIYELFFQGTEFTKLPACVYGLVMYLAIFILGWLGLSRKNLQLDVHVETELTIGNNKEDK